MKNTKEEKLQIKTSSAWKARVKTAAQNADTTVSQFIRDAVNARIAQQEQAKSA